MLDQIAAEQADLTQLSDDLENYLSELKQAQQAVLAIQQVRQAALVRGDWTGLAALEQREHAGQRLLQLAVERRAKLLQRFRNAGISGQTLTDVCRQLEWHADPERRQLLTEVRENSEQLRRGSWSMWVMSQRAARFYEKLATMISQGGQATPGYSEHFEPPLRNGGTLLDASI